MTSRRRDIASLAGEAFYKFVVEKDDKKKRRQGRRPHGYLRMMDKGAAFEIGVKEAFLKGMMARRRLKSMGVKGPRHARKISQKLFNHAMQYSDPKQLRAFDKLVRAAGW